MKFLNKKLFVNVFISLVVFLPLISLAGTFKDNFFPIIQCGTGSEPCNFLDAVLMINRIINLFIGLAATIGAVTLAYSGARILMNPGSESELKDAKTRFWKTLLGLFWLLAGWVLVYTLVNTFVSKDIDALRFLK